MSALTDSAAAEGLAIPAHIAIVMDGNGRWATQRGLPRLAGHVEGRKATKRAIIACNDLGVTALSLYVFSTENWNRPDDEVSGLMQLIERAFREELEEMRDQNVNFRASGRLDGLPRVALPLVCPHRPALRHRGVPAAAAGSRLAAVLGRTGPLERHPDLRQRPR